MGWRQVEFPLLVLTPTPGSFTGLFVYSGAPATGNLILSIAAAAGTDPFGNPYPANLTSFFVAVPGQNLNMNAGGLTFTVPGEIFTGLLTALAGSGGAAGVPSLSLLSPSNINSGTNDSEALVSVVGRSSSGLVGPYIILGSLQQGASNVQGIPVYAVGGGLVYAAPGVPGGLLVAEDWHNVTPSAGFTLGNPPLRVKVLAEKKLAYLYGTINGTFAAGFSTCATVPALYSPSFNSLIECFTNSGGAVPCGVSTAAQIFETLPAGVTSLTFNGTYPLD